MRAFYFTVFLILFGLAGFAQPIIYVKHDASGANNGTTWLNAYTNLQQAINNSNPGQEIWVSGGTYFPDEDKDGNIPADPRDKTFHLKAGVSVFGGFIGNEITKPVDPLENPTILSGDIGSGGDPSDNTYHVMYNNNINTGTTELVGFIIEKGNCKNNNNDSSGGGLLDRLSNISYKQILFRNNLAGSGGGAITRTSNSSFKDCSFKNNTAVGSGAGFACQGAKTELISCIFIKNNAGGSGGGFWGLDAELEMNDCLFFDNSATGSGGAISMSATNLNENAPASMIYNTVFENNNSPVGAALFIHLRPVFLSNFQCINNTGKNAIRMTGHVNISNSVIQGGIHLHSNYYPTDVKVYNSTIIGTSANGDTAISSKYIDGNAQLSFYNTILDGNININPNILTTYANCLIPGSKPNGVWDNTLGNDNGSNIDDDPIYFSEAKEDYRLWKCSPGIDQGDSTILSIDWHDLNINSDTLEKIPVDLFGLSRINNSQADIGAFEYHPEALIGMDTLSLFSNLPLADSIIWIHCASGQVVSNDSSFIHPPDSTDFYYLVISRGGCTDTSACIEYIPNISQPEKLKAVELSIYPNPVVDLLYIQQSRGTEYKTLQLFTLSGKLIYEAELSAESKTTIDLNGVKSGVYLFNLNDGKGRSASGKLVIQ